MSKRGAVSRVIVGAGRAGARLLPQRVRRVLDDRVFSVVFQLTRVTNDHYGWRPETPAGRPGDPVAGDPAAGGPGETDAGGAGSSGAE